ncbi:MAG: hypothetical protein M1814_001602 [Vezdaea aestivalis]|nr:MAG: hypothetical protein M1814_001602 [Vezdaea aestivalis]
MVPNPPQHQRSQSLLLLKRLLQLRENVSPFILVLDSLEQSSRPLVSRISQYARQTETPITLLAYATPSNPQVTTHIRAHGLTTSQLQSALPTPLPTPHLIVIDSLNTLSTYLGDDLPTFLSSLLRHPRTTLLATYHLDVPHVATNAYAPIPLTLLRYLATTILTVHSFAQSLARKEARDRALPEPVFGLAEGKEGVVVGLGANDPRGVVVEMEHRRKSGRGVGEWFFVPAEGEGELEVLSLVPGFEERKSERADKTQEEVSFELGLTERQKRDREGVVLPYFDAQAEGKRGDGGRILYDMGEEDDFDEEEDEI